MPGRVGARGGGRPQEEGGGVGLEAGAEVDRVGRDHRPAAGAAAADARGVGDGYVFGALPEPFARQDPQRHVRGQVSVAVRRGGEAGRPGPLRRFRIPAWRSACASPGATGARWTSGRPVGSGSGSASADDMARRGHRLRRQQVDRALLVV